MSTKRKLFHEAFNALMTALIVLPALVVIEKLLLPEQTPWLGVAFLAAVAVCYPAGRLLRTREKQTALSIGAVLSALLTIPVLVRFGGSVSVISAVALFLLTMLCGILTFIIPFIYGSSIPSGKFFVAGLALYVIALALGGEHAESYSAVLNTCAVVLLIVALFVFNILGLLRATTPSGGKARFPKGMRRNNMIILAIFVVFAVVLANIRAIKDATVAAGMWVLDKITDFLLAAANLTGAPDLPDGERSPGSGGMDLSGLITELPAVNPFTEMLWQIFLYLLIAGIIVVVCLLLYKLIRLLITRFGGILDKLMGRITPVDESYIDEVEDLETDDGEKRDSILDRLRRRFVQRAKFGDMPSPRAKVRFAMREFLRANPARRAETADELLPELERVAPGYGESFRAAYNRARYSPDDVSEADAELARRVANRL